MKIKSNYHWNNFLYGYELTEKEKDDFDYVYDINSESFFRYKHCTYWIGDFLNIDPSNSEHPFSGWHGYISESYFSAIVIRISEDAEQYQVGLALC